MALRAWAAAGPYPGSLYSPRTEKTTVTTDRYGDRVETKQVADAVAGDYSVRRINDRYGGQLVEESVRDAYTGRTQLSRTRSESPLGFRGRALALDDPLYARSALALDDPLYRRSYLDDPLYRHSALALDDPLYTRSALALDDPLYRRSYLDDPLYRRSALDYPRRSSVLGRSSFYDDALYGYGGYGYGGLSYGGLGYGGLGYAGLGYGGLYGYGGRRSYLHDSPYRRSGLGYGLCDRLDDPLYRRNPLRAFV